jgi:hypothetical protein
MVIETCREYRNDMKKTPLRENDPQYRNDSWNRYRNNYPSYPLILMIILYIGILE